MKVNPTRLYYACGIALMVNALTFAVRAGMIQPVGIEFGLDTVQLAWMVGAVFWGYPIALLTGGFFMERLGPGTIILLGFSFHFLGIGITIFSNSYWWLFGSMALIGLGNGTMESITNPLVAGLFPDEKSKKLNHLHRWFPIGLIVGGSIVFVFGEIGLDWRIQNAVLLLAVMLYGVLFFRQAVNPFMQGYGGKSIESTLKILRHPLFLLLLIIMMGTAITESAPNQWIDVLLKNIVHHPILILIFIGVFSTIGRSAGASLSKWMSPAGLLFLGAMAAGIGLWGMSRTEGGFIFVTAAVFSFGVALFWPNMLAYATEYFPKINVLGLAIMGTVASTGSAFFFPLMGGFYDSIIFDALPAGSDLQAFRTALAGSEEANLFESARRIAGKTVLNRLAYIPVFLTLVFGILLLYDWKRKAKGVRRVIKS